MSEPRCLLSFEVKHGDHAGKTCIGFTWDGPTGTPPELADWLNKNVNSDAILVNGCMVYFAIPEDALMCWLRFQ